MKIEVTGTNFVDNMNYLRKNTYFLELHWENSSVWILGIWN